MTKDAIIVFLKNPQLGKVKTRLAKSIGDEKTLNLYKKMALETLAQASHVNADVFQFYSNDLENVFELKGFKSEIMMQSDGDLGQKMADAFQKVFELGYQKIIIIGSDCPGLDSSVLEKGFKALSVVDVVIGSANDGGYYLLGMNASFKNLFKDKIWSTDSVYEDTLADIRKMDLSYAQLPELTDIDTIEDLKKAGYV